MRSEKPTLVGFDPKGMALAAHLEYAEGEPLAWMVSLTARLNNLPAC